MIAFQVSDRTSHRAAGLVTKAVKEADRVEASDTAGE